MLSCENKGSLLTINTDSYEGALGRDVHTSCPVSKRYAPSNSLTGQIIKLYAFSNSVACVYDHVSFTRRETC